TQAALLDAFSEGCVATASRFLPRHHKLANSSVVKLATIAQVNSHTGDCCQLPRAASTFGVCGCGINSRVSSSRLPPVEELCKARSCSTTTFFSGKVALRTELVVVSHH